MNKAFYQEGVERRNTADCYDGGPSGKAGHWRYSDGGYNIYNACYGKDTSFFLHTQQSTYKIFYTLKNVKPSK